MDVDRDDTEISYDGTLAVVHLSVETQDNCQAVPGQRESSLPFNTTCPGGDMSRLNSSRSSSLSLLAHPSLGSFKDLPSVLGRREVRRPSEVIISRPDWRAGQPSTISHLETCG